MTRTLLTAILFYVIGKHGLSIDGGAPGIAAVWGSIEVGLWTQRALERRQRLRAASRHWVMEKDWWRE